MTASLLYSKSGKGKGTVDGAGRQHPVTPLQPRRSRERGDSEVGERATYRSLQTFVKGIGQIEIDEIYVGVNRHGQQFVVPVQAKGGGDQLGVTQTRQDIACCFQKFPLLTVRAVSAQFMADDTIAMFELALQGDDVKILEERHYKLVPCDQITPDDLKLYSKR